jgi:hypothetical protein
VQLVLQQEALRPALAPDEPQELRRLQFVLPTELLRADLLPAANLLRFVLRFVLRSLLQEALRSAEPPLRPQELLQ